MLLKGTVKEISEFIAGNNQLSCPTVYKNFVESTEFCLYNFFHFVGFVTDGEFNSMRTKGSSRPISIIQLIMDSKAEARHINVHIIRKYLTPVKVQGISL